MYIISVFFLSCLLTGCILKSALVETDEYKIQVQNAKAQETTDTKTDTKASVSTSEDTKEAKDTDTTTK